MKSGMTNNSSVFAINNSKYVLRIPGAGTDKLIDRSQEKHVYTLLENENISEKLIHFDEETGLKISKFIENGHNCDITNESDVKKCMRALKSFHNKRLKCLYEFDFRKIIKKYEELCDVHILSSIELRSLKNRLNTLLHWIDSLDKEKCLCQIDCNVDNFVITSNKTYLIDWEYAGMQDPHLDVAMFILYSNLLPEEADKVIKMYCGKNVDTKTKMKIYAYIALSGYIWGLWCDYKLFEHNIDYGSYHISQYHKSLLYSRIVNKYLNEQYYEINSAIILAAGKGERLKPLTNIIAKPLIPIKSVPLIEDTIVKLLNKGIYNITIVTGYNSHQFNYLKEKYNVTLIHNSKYDTSNNIHSLKAASYLIRNALILDGDQYIKNTSILKTFVQKSGYVYYDSDSTKHEWSLHLDENNNIKHIDASDTTSHKLRSISYWVGDDALTLRKLLSTYNDDSNLFWDDVVAQNISKFKLTSYKTNKEDVVEIDTLQDLISLDETYRGED